MSIKILLADDSITIQKVVGIIFGGEEYCLTVVDNGKAAVDRALDVSPDILIVDALMPGISGYEVCETIRATPTLAHTPILLLTGSFEPFDEERANSCGADDFLAKPFESQQILSKVQELYALGLSRVASSAQPEPQIDSSSVIPVEPVETTGTVMAFDTNDIWNAFTPATVEQPDETPRLGTFAETSYSFAEPVTAVFDKPETLVAETSLELGDTLPTAAETAPVALTEEQLKAAIATVSRDVIERIVWEVVPDIAEKLIKEAIVRITGENGNIQQGDKY